MTSYDEYLLQRATRRRFLQRAGIVTMTLGTGPSFLAACGGSPSKLEADGGGKSSGSGTIDFLSWEGYDLLKETKSWREENKVEIRSTYIAEQGEIQPKMKANTGVDVDLITYPQGWADDYVAAHVISPIAKSGIKNFSALYPFFRDGRAWVRDGEIIGVPFTWGTTVSNYVPDKVDPPNSWNDLLKPELKGKVGWTGSPISSIKLAAVVLGLDSSPNLSKEQLDECIGWLRKLRDQIRGFAPSFGDLTTQMVSGEVLVTFDGWSAVNAFAGAQGGKVKSVMPKEGSHSFADAYAIPPDSDAREVTVAFIDHALTPEIQAAQAKSLSAGVVNPAAVPMLDAEIARLYPYDELDSLIERAPFVGIPPLESPDNATTTRDEWVEAFQAVKTGQ
jgi:spermidine/putrescine transport system substrate-binding protein